MGPVVDMWYGGWRAGRHTSQGAHATSPAQSFPGLPHPRPSPPQGPSPAPAAAAAPSAPPCAPAQPPRRPLGRAARPPPRRPARAAGRRGAVRGRAAGAPGGTAALGAGGGGVGWGGKGGAHIMRVCMRIGTATRAHTQAWRANTRAVSFIHCRGPCAHCSSLCVQSPVPLLQWARAGGLTPGRGPAGAARRGRAPPAAPATAPAPAPRAWGGWPGRRPASGGGQASMHGRRGARGVAGAHARMHGHGVDRRSHIRTCVHDTPRHA